MLTKLTFKLKKKKNCSKNTDYSEIQNCAKIVYK